MDMFFKDPMFLIFLYVAAAILVFLFVLRLFLKRAFIYEYQIGLLYKNGRFNKLLTPGPYWMWKQSSTLNMIDSRKQLLTLPGQEVLTADQIHLKISLLISYQIENPVLAVHETQNYLENLYAYAQTVLRMVVTDKKSDDLLSQRNVLAESMKPLIEQRAAAIGLKIHSVDIKDFLLPGELKKVFAEIVRAQKEGQAALERARGESASLRNLANAAKLLENNPALLQLRILQTLSPTQGSSGNTLVWGVPQGGVVPLNLPSKTNPPSSSDKERIED